MRFGMDYGGTNIKAGVFDENGKTVNFIEKKLTEFSSSGNLLDNLISHAKSVIGDNKISSGGLAIKGLINTETGVLENDIGAGQMLAGINLKKTFSDALGFPFYVENDARAYAWGEYKFGAGQGSKAMVCMTLGTGYGCSLVAEGKPYCGSDSLGGLLGGHISIDRNGPECSCGNRGCLELYCSATALIKMVKEKHPLLLQKQSQQNTQKQELSQNISDKLKHLIPSAENKNSIVSSTSAKDSKNSVVSSASETEYSLDVEILPLFFEEVRNGNKDVLVTFNEFIENLAIGIVNTIHAYGPDVIVLGGGVLNSSEIILPPLTQLVHRRAWTVPKNKVQIRKSLLGNNAAAIGVAFLNN